VCCSVLQCVAVCCSVLQCVAVCGSALQCDAVCCSVLQCIAVYCSVLQCIAVCCSVLRCVAVCCSVLPTETRFHDSCMPAYHQHADTSETDASEADASEVEMYSSTHTGEGNKSILYIYIYIQFFRVTVRPNSRLRALYIERCTVLHRAVHTGE